jgi:hypothetical protein
LKKKTTYVCDNYANGICNRDGGERKFPHAPREVRVYSTIARNINSPAKQTFCKTVRREYKEKFKNG